MSDCRTPPLDGVMGRTRPVSRPVGSSLPGPVGRRPQQPAPLVALVGQVAVGRSGSRRTRDLVRAVGSRTGRVAPSALRRECLERDVEFEDVHAGLTDEAEGAAVSVLVDEFAHLVDGQPVLLRHPVDLDVGVVGGRCPRAWAKPVTTSASRP